MVEHSQHRVSRLKKEAAIRKKTYREISVSKSAVNDYLEKGWEVEKPLKIKTRLRKAWGHDERLENRVWYLFYLLGYPEISEGRNFQMINYFWRTRSSTL